MLDEMPLGAAPRRVVRMILKEAAVLVGIGIGAGVPCALALGRALQSLLFGVQPTDPVVATVAVGTLTTVAAVAAWIPARRAAEVDPLIALKAE